MSPLLYGRNYQGSNAAFGTRIYNGVVWYPKLLTNVNETFRFQETNSYMKGKGRIRLHEPTEIYDEGKICLLKLIHITQNRKSQNANSGYTLLIKWGDNARPQISCL